MSMDKESLLSIKEDTLHAFILTSKEKVTVKLIEEHLGKEYTGALGKLLSKELIESKKYRAQFNPLSPTKMTKYYAIKVEEKNE